MLVLSRFVDQEIVIGPSFAPVIIKVVLLEHDRVRLGITASPDVIVDRREIWDARQLKREQKP